MLLAVTVPTEPAAETPVSAVETPPFDIAPTLPAADTPVRAIVMLGVVVPTAPVAALPVNATETPLALGSEENGVCENAEIPNMVYGVRRLRIKLLLSE